MGCVTNVDSYSLNAFTYVAGVRDISNIVCYYQVLIAAVTKLQQFEEKTTTFFAASGFHNIANIHVCSTAHTLLENDPYIPYVPSLSTMWD